MTEFGTALKQMLEPVGGEWTLIIFITFLEGGWMEGGWIADRLCHNHGGWEVGGHSFYHNHGGWMASWLVDG